MTTIVLWAMGLGWVFAICFAITARRKQLQVMLLGVPLIVAGLTFTGGCGGDDTAKPNAASGLTDAEKAELEAAKKAVGDDGVNAGERKKAEERVAELEKKASSAETPKDAGGQEASANVLPPPGQDRDDLEKRLRARIIDPGDYCAFHGCQQSVEEAAAQLAQIVRERDQVAAQAARQDSLRENTGGRESVVRYTHSPAASPQPPDPKPLGGAARVTRISNRQADGYIVYRPPPR